MKTRLDNFGRTKRAVATKTALRTIAGVGLYVVTLFWFFTNQTVTKMFDWLFKNTYGWQWMAGILTVAAAALILSLIVGKDSR